MPDTKFEWTDEYVLEWAAYLSKKRVEWASLHNNRAADPPDIFILNEFKASKCPDNSQWQKIKPLFKTTDDIMIYEGMTYWTVDKDFLFYYSGAAGEGSGISPNKKYFHTEKAMHNWIYENKPIYSVKDFREIIKAFEERIAPKTPQ